MTDARQSLGSRGEEATCDWYRSRGYRLVARNWCCRLGELDLVVTRGDTLVFCEVKSRRGSGLGGGWEAVDARKRAKVRTVAQAYLQASGAVAGAIRFDVASVRIGSGPRSAQVEMFEDAF